jgi:hypothetical protein
MGAPAIIGVKLVAAAGGCKQRINNIIRMEPPTAEAAAVEMSVKHNENISFF